MVRANIPAAHTPGVLSELAAAYVKGASIRDLASVRGWSYGATHKRLQAAASQGLMQMRSRGARRRLTQGG